MERQISAAAKRQQENIITVLPELLHTFIKRIGVGERTKKYSRNASRDISILDDIP